MREAEARRAMAEGEGGGAVMRTSTKWLIACYAAALVSAATSIVAVVQDDPNHLWAAAIWLLTTGLCRAGYHATKEPRA